MFLFLFGWPGGVGRLVRMAKYWQNLFRSGCVSKLGYALASFLINYKIIILVSRDCVTDSGSNEN